MEGYKIYSGGVEHADNISKKLYGAVKFYSTNLSHESPSTDAAQTHYWHALDQKHRLLIQMAGSPELYTGDKGLIGGPNAEDPWTKTVQEAAFAAYQAVCPRTTPRQIQAYAAGIKPLYKALFPKDQAKASPKRLRKSNHPTPQPQNS